MSIWLGLSFCMYSHVIKVEDSRVYHDREMVWSVHIVVLKLLLLSPSIALICHKKQKQKKRCLKAIVTGFINFRLLHSCSRWTSGNGSSAGRPQTVSPASSVLFLDLLFALVVNISGTMLVSFSLWVRLYEKLLSGSIFTEPYLHLHFNTISSKVGFKCFLTSLLSVKFKPQKIACGFCLGCIYT